MKVEAAITAALRSRCGEVMTPALELFKRRNIFARERDRTLGGDKNGGTKKEDEQGCVLCTLRCDNQVGTFMLEKDEPKNQRTFYKQTVRWSVQ